MLHGAVCDCLEKERRSSLRAREGLDHVHDSTSGTALAGTGTRRVPARLVKFVVVLFFS